MSVKIPISADASQAVSAINQVTSAIRKAGQEGRRFSELDLSHEELRPFADDIQRIQENFEELKKIGRGETAAAVRAGDYADFISWNEGHGRQFPSEKQRRGHAASVSSYITQNTRWQSAGDEPANSGSDGKGSGGLPIAGLGKMLGIGLGLAGIGKITSLLSEGIGGAQDEAISLDVFKRQINDTSTAFDVMRSSLRDAAEGLELTYQETVKLAQGFSKASAMTNQREITEEVRTGAGFARSFGLDEKQVTQVLGQARWLGMSNSDSRELAVMFADAIASGNMWAKADEVMSAIVGWVDQAETVMVDAPNIQAYAAYSSAMNASNRPGLQGQSGTSLLAQMDQAVRQNGRAGEAGQNFIWRALTQEGSLNPFQMRFLLEEGMFGRRQDAFKQTAPKLAVKGGTNFENIQSMLGKEYPNSFQRWDAMSRLFGISMHQASALDDLKPSRYGRLGDMLNRFKLDPKKSMQRLSRGWPTWPWPMIKNCWPCAKTRSSARI